MANCFARLLLLVLAPQSLALILPATRAPARTVAANVHFDAHGRAAEDLTVRVLGVHMQDLPTARMLGVHTLEVQAAREEDFSSRLSPRANFRGCTALHYAALTGLTSGRYPDYAIYDQCFQPAESIQVSLCIHSLQTAGVLFHSC